MTSLSPPVERALQLRLQRDPPFTEEDLATVSGLSVLFPTDLGDLARMTALQVLILIGYGGRDLKPLAGLPLRTLKIRVSAVSDLSVVAELPGLWELAVPNNVITEIDVLADRDSPLQEVDLTGNPLSDHAYREVVPALREQVPDVRVSGEREWRLTRRLHAAGLPFDVYRGSDRYRLCRPGLAYTPYPDADHVAVDPDELAAMLDRDPAAIPALFPARDAS